MKLSRLAAVEAVINSGWLADSRFDLGRKTLSVFRNAAFPRLTVSRFEAAGSAGGASIYHVEGVSAAFDMIGGAIDALNRTETPDGD